MYSIGPSPGARRREVVEPRARGMRKCEECRRLKRICQAPPGGVFSDEEQCERCKAAGKPCGPKTVPTIRPLSGQKRSADKMRSPPQRRTSELNTPSSSRNSQGAQSGSQFRTSDIIASELTLDSQRNRLFSPSTSAEPVLNETTRTNHPLRRIEPNHTTSTSAAVRQELDDRSLGTPKPVVSDSSETLLDSLAELLIMIKCGDDTSHTTALTENAKSHGTDLKKDMDLFVRVLAKKALKVLNRVLAYIDRLKTEPRHNRSGSEDSEHLCWKILSLLDLYGDVSAAQEIVDKKAIILRKLIEIYDSLGRSVQIHSLLVRLRQIPNLALTEWEQQLLALSYQKTSSNMQHILDDHNIDVEEYWEFRDNTEDLFPATNRAIRDEDSEVVERLLMGEGYAAPKLDLLKRQPLHIAAASHRPHLLQMCIRFYSREVNARDLFGRTPLHYAVDEGDLEAFKTLIKAGADVHNCDNLGRSVLTYAAKGHVEIIWHMLHIMSVRPDEPNSRGTIGPLHQAAKNNQSAIIRLLRIHGARDYDLPDGRSAYMIAQEEGCNEAFENFGDAHPGSRGEEASIEASSSMPPNFDLD